jgi:hypothetical protein
MKVFTTKLNFKTQKNRKIKKMNKIVEPESKKKQLQLTKAQKELAERNNEKFVEKLQKKMKLTHREKIKKFNNYLEGLNTQFDIPKI